MILQLDVSQTNRQTIVEMVSLFLFQDFQEVIVFWKRGKKEITFGQEYIHMIGMSPKFA